MEYQFETCAVNRQGKGVMGGINTCFSTKSLVRLAKEYNKFNSNNAIQLNAELETDKQYLYKQIQKRLNKVCDNELCWIKQDFVKKLDDSEIEHATFKPPRPSGSSWLSNKDIYKVMYQFMQKYKDFTFFGPVPIDFYTITKDESYFWHQICKEIKHLNLKKLRKRNINKIGIVFNLDPHNKGGSHWVAMYIQNHGKTPEINYFDSVGDGPPRQISNMISRLQKTSNEQFGSGMSYKFNNLKIQKENNECGMYCINFISSRVSGKDFNQATKPINDKKMNKLKNYFFLKKRR